MGQRASSCACSIGNVKLTANLMRRSHAGFGAASKFPMPSAHRVFNRSPRFVLNGFRVVGSQTSESAGCRHRRRREEKPGSFEKPSFWLRIELRCAGFSWRRRLVAVWSGYGSGRLGRLGRWPNHRWYAARSTVCRSEVLVLARRER